jgi:hypothetical protein
MRSRRPLVIAAALAAIAGLWLVSNRLQATALAERTSWPDADEFVILPPARTAPFLYAGYNEVGADINWARGLVYYGSAVLGESDLRYLERFIDTVLELDPKFKRVYFWASAAVTFRSTKAERDGTQFIAATDEEFRLSAKYLRRGIEEFPDEYQYYLTLALRLWWDIEPKDAAERRANRLEAAQLLDHAITLPSAPPGASTTVANLWSELGEFEHAKRALRQQLMTTDNKEAQAKILERFRGLFPADRESELLERAKNDFEAARAKALPWAHADLFVLIGPEPDPVIRIDAPSSVVSAIGEDGEDGEDEDGEGREGDDAAP